mmetsp:Transcript_12590/g.16558  ORF Transcript_12590/g.16558 Transcript_12590/m.16558 type:complete len:109 (+) Transcript_12590:417-743(+)
MVRLLFYNTSPTAIVTILAVTILNVWDCCFHDTLDDSLLRLPDPSVGAIVGESVTSSLYKHQSLPISSLIASLYKHPPPALHAYLMLSPTNSAQPNGYSPGHRPVQSS